MFSPGKTTFEVFVLAFIKCVSDLTVGRGGGGGSEGLPQKISGLKSVKSCNCSQNKHGSHFHGSQG